jgi:predicted small lipoprotein YifL
MRRIGYLSLILATSLVVSGCGRKGPLEAPNAKAPAAATEATTDPLTTAPLPKSAKPKASPKTDSSSPFLLDPLL